MKVEKKNIILFIFNVLLFILMTVVFQNPFILFILLIFSLMLFFVYIKQKELFSSYALGAVVVILIVLGIYFANIFAYGEPYYLGGSDDGYFEESAKIASEKNVFNPAHIQGNIIGLYDMGAGYISFLAVLIEVSELFGGYHTILPRLFNIIFLILSLMIVNYFVAKTGYLNLRLQQVFTFIFLATPNIGNIGGYIFRDSYNLFQVFLATLLVYTIFKNKNILRKVLACILIIPLVYFMYYTRSQSIVFVLLLLIPLLINTSFRSKIALLVFSSGILILSLEFFKLERYITRYTDYLRESANGLSGIIFDLDLFPLGIIARFMYGLISPFPNFFILFQENNVVLLDIITLLVYLGVIAQIILLPFMFRALIKLDWVSISFIFMYLIFIITTFTFRHYIFYYPFMLLLTIKGFTLIPKKLRLVFLTVLYLSLTGLIYILIKIF